MILKMGAWKKVDLVFRSALGIVLGHKHLPPRTEFGALPRKKYVKYVTSCPIQASHISHLMSGLAKSRTRAMTKP